MNRQRSLIVLDRTALAALILLVMAIPWPHTMALRNLSYALLLLAVLIQRWGFRERIFRPGELLAFILLEGIMLIPAVVTAADRTYAVRLLRKEYLWLLGLYLAVTAVIRSRRRLEDLLGAVALSTSALAGFGIYGFFAGTMISQDGRATSAYLSPTRAGYLIAMLFPVILMAFYRARTVRRLLLFGMALVVQTCYLITTYSRGAWLGVVVSLVLIGLFQDRRILIFLLLALLVSSAIMPERVMERALTSIDLARFKESTVGGDRYWLLSSSLQMIRDHPLTGIGYGRRSFEIVYPNYRHAEASQPHYFHCHNLYVQAVVERGFLGGLALLAVFAAALVLAARIVWEDRDPWTTSVALGILSALGCFLSIGLVTYRYDGEMSNILWLLLGLLAAARAMGYHRNPPERGT